MTYYCIYLSIRPVCIYLCHTGKTQPIDAILFTVSDSVFDFVRPAVRRGSTRGAGLIKYGMLYAAMPRCVHRQPSFRAVGQLPREKSAERERVDDVTSVDVQ